MITSIKNFIKALSLQIIFLLLIFGCVFVFAINFPATPSGETTGGKFMDYFNRILINTGNTTDGTVKKTLITEKLFQGDCGTGKILQGFNSSGSIICVIK